MNWSVFEASCGPGTINDGALGYKGSGGGVRKGAMATNKKRRKKGGECSVRKRMGQSIIIHELITHKKAEKAIKKKTEGSG